MSEEKIEFEDFVNNLDRKMWITRDCRYNSDRRLKKKNTLSLTAISFLSLYVLIISIFTTIEDGNLSEATSKSLSIASIVISLFILILSLLETSKEYAIKAERLYNCANIINKLMSDLKIAKATIKDQKELEISVNKINHNYHEIISGYEENHEELDYLKFMIDNKKREIAGKDGKHIHIGDFDIGWLFQVKYFIKKLRHLSLYYFCIFGPFILFLFLSVKDTILTTLYK